MQKLAAVMAAATLLLAGAAFAGDESSWTTYGAALSSAETVPAGSSAATGAATLWWAADAGAIHYVMRVADLDQPISADLHLGAVGENGPVIALLPAQMPLPGRPDGPVTGVLAAGTLTPAHLVGPMKGKTLADLAAEIAAGKVYAIVRTQARPGGEIRGTLLPVQRALQADMTQTIALETPYYKTGGLIVVDVNGDGQNQAHEVIEANAKTFNWDDELVFSWQPVPGATAYRIALVQMWPNTDQIAAAIETGMLLPWLTWTDSQQLKVAFHRIEDPQPTRFTLGSFGFGEGICLFCPSLIWVSPQTASKVYNDETGSYEYRYAPLEGGWQQVSGVFWLTQP